MTSICASDKARGCSIRETAFITSRSQTFFTTARSWEMNSIVRPYRQRKSSSRLMIWAWTGHIGMKQAHRRSTGVDLSSMPAQSEPAGIDHPIVQRVADYSTQDRCPPGTSSSAPGIFVLTGCHYLRYAAALQWLPLLFVGGSGPK